MIPVKLQPYKWGIVAAIAAALFAAGLGVGWQVQSWRLGTDLAELQARQATDRADAAEGDLKQFKDGVAAVAAAASQARQINNAAARSFAAIAQEFMDAKPPLPDDCRPDDVRLRERNAAIGVYNAARAGQQSGR